MVSGNFNRPTDTVRRLRTVLLASSALCLASALPAAAQDATWNSAPGTGDFNTGANWTPAAVPTGTAFFGTSSMTALSLSSVTTVGGWTFNTLSSAYSFTNSGQSLSFTGAGIDIQGGSVAITNDNLGSLTFNNNSTAGSAAITNTTGSSFGGGRLIFNNNSTAGTATITNRNGPVFFNDASTAGSATILTDGGFNNVYFNNTSTAGSATITANNHAEVHFNATSTAGSATLTTTNGGSLIFDNASTAGNATITNNSGNYVSFGATSTAGNATITNNGYLNFSATSTAGRASIVNNYGEITFLGTSTAGSASITSNGNLNFYTTSTAGAATITSSGNVIFNNSSSAGSASITSTDTLRFNDSSTAGSASIVNTGGVSFTGSSKAGSARIINNNFGGVDFKDTSSAENATITNNAQLRFADNSTAGSATITNTSQLTFDTNTTAGNATITNSGNVLFDGNSTAGNAQLINTAPGAVINFFTPGPASDGRISAGSIAGNGRFDLNGAELTVGGNNLSSNVTGVLTGTGIATGTSLIKIGTGTLTLAGVNTYTGATSVDAGRLAVNGSITASSGVTVNNGGTLAGVGTVGNTAINSGGTLAAGNGTAGSSMNVTGSLALQSGAFYMVQINPATSSFADVTGAATLGGSTVKAIYANGGYVAKQYTILTAGSVRGTFGAVVDTNLPSNFHTTLSYDASHAYLNLVLTFVPPPGTGLSGNQNAVGNAIVNFFNSNGGIPLVYSALTPTGLTQASGETAAGSQQTTFNAMNQFMGVMTDPFLAGRGDGVGAGGAPNAYAGESLAYASKGEGRSRSERDAYAMFTKAPLAQTYEPRWSVWAAGFGGSQTTDGNAALGSNATTSRLFGTAVGADYRFSPNTIAGFALAGGGTNFSVTGGGSGRSDLFQAGAFVHHTVGAAYLSGALAYGWQDVTTDRTVTIAGVDRLRAAFNANAYSGRVEGGYRYVTPWAGGVGLTPYAAGQFTTFDLPAYAEQAISGANTFALAYGSKSVTDTRSELGLRADKSYAVQNAILTLRGRAAWAHDFNPDRTIGTTFQALPGASFVVNGARQASDSALTTASAEMKWINGWSAAATFEGEFSNVTRAYAGKGVVRYAW